MSTDKRWTYRQITAATEEKIASALKHADEAPELAHLYRARAHGAYGVWYELTCGWQGAGDSQRLSELIDSHRECETANRS